MLTPHPMRHRRLRGLGQLVCSDQNDPTTCVDTSTAVPPMCADDCSFVGPLQPGQTYCQSGGLTPQCPTVTPLPTSPGASTTSHGIPINWNTLLQGIISGTSAGVTLSQLTNLPAGSVYQQTPKGVYASNVGTASGPYASGLTTATVGNILPIAIGAGLLLLFVMSRNR